jgi:fermentation-respiration switch protein FrsA (DUF1100 family)
VDAAVRWARDRRAAGVPIIYWGRSLGATMAAYGATVAVPDALILESGFPDVRTLLRESPILAFASLFSSYRFPTADFLREVRAPVLIIHGDHDRVVPFQAGRALFDRFAGPKQFLAVTGGDHNDLVPRDPEAYWRAIEAVAASARHTTPPE